MKKVIVFDVDGTLSNGLHSGPAYDVKPRDWELVRSKSLLDPVHDEIKYLNNILFCEADTIILIVTARREKDRDVTVEWFKKHGISFHDMYMRKDGDTRPDYEMKEEILYDIMKEYGTKPYLVFEDRSSVVEMWRKHGVKCLQVEENDI